MPEWLEKLLVYSLCIGLFAGWVVLDIYWLKRIFREKNKK